MKKNLGGDRLGSGAKINVDLHGYERSTHDLGFIWRNTQAPGTLVPFMNILGLPGDTFDIDLNANVLTHPTVGPLFGSFKLQLDVFTAPIRLYQRQLHNNKLGVGLNIASIKFPLVALTAPNIDTASEVPPEFQQINQSCIFAYLGIRGLGAQDNGNDGLTMEKNALPFLSYWDIVKNYYINKQETNAYVIHAAGATLTSGNVRVGDITTEIYPVVHISERLTSDTIAWFNGTNLTKESVLIKLQQDGTTDYDFPLEQVFKKVSVENDGQDIYCSGVNIAYTEGGVFTAVGASLNANETFSPRPNLLAFPVANLDTMRENLMAAPTAARYLINTSGLAPYTTGIANLPEEDYKTYLMFPQEGLAVKTYQSDIFNNWIQTDTITGVNGISAVTAVSTAGGSFTIDTLNLSKKVYDMLNRIAVSGGSYQDWVETVYDHNSMWRSEVPVYHGGLSKEIVFQEVVSQAKVDEENPLGTLGGRGVLGHKHKGGHCIIKVDEPCFIMGIVSITPRVDYSQGNDWTINLKTLDDLHKPALDQIGFQDLITEGMAYWESRITGGVYEKYSAGKQPAWLNYMTNFNKTYGNFADARNEMYMTLNRRYSMNKATKRIKDLTTYIDPSKFNYAFAQTDLSAMNFWVQIGVDITARRKMSAKVIPNL